MLLGWRPSLLGWSLSLSLSLCSEERAKPFCTILVFVARFGQVAPAAPSEVDAALHGALVGIAQLDRNGVHTSKVLC